VRFLRRREPAGAESATTEQETTTPTGDAQAGRAGTVGKGRPTPKRREAEARRRRGPAAPPPRTQREALRRLRGTKEERRAERAERRARMLEGDDRYLLPRDRGPVRAYVRDLVDSRRQIMGLFMPLAGVVLLSLFVPIPAVQSAVSLLTMAMLAVIVVETLFLGRHITQRVRRKFPDAKDSGLGLTFYAFTRATMMRRLRTPRPRVGYGQMRD
jgi:Protein of unknown function (DUF3043)